MTNPIHAANPLLRFCVLTGSVLLLLAGVGFLAWLQWTLAAVDDAAYEAMVETYRRLRFALGLLILLTGPAVLATGLWLSAVSRAALHEQRWPPSGARMPQDQRVLSGAAGVAKARQMAFAAALCLFSAVVVMIGGGVLWWRLA